MKKVLLTTTALVMTAGVSSADVTMSGSAELTYGNWGTLGAGAESWGSTTDLGVSMSGEASGISYTASISIDETDSATAADIGGAITMSGSGLSLTYDADGEMDAGGTSDDSGDLQVAYSNGTVSASYTEDSSAGNNEIVIGYSTGDLSVGYSKSSLSPLSGLSASFSAGALAITVSGADDGSTWDASAAYTIGASTVTAATDELSATSVKVATSLNDITLTAKAQEGDNELTVGYTMGDITLSYAYNEGADLTGADSDGDDAQTILSVSYALGGVTITGQANSENEVEVAAAFTF
ncbi:MAG: hypothetical protein HOH32_10785 [Rhodobacteraceae bacterium]|nr:hypothetical protein [Paracoccaceae bacterium]MBT6545988.1 hypothetical protein [Paracoccaceae bacterium]